MYIMESFLNKESVKCEKEFPFWISHVFVTRLQPLTIGDADIFADFGKSTGEAFDSTGVTVVLLSETNHSICICDWFTKHPLVSNAW